MAGDDTYDIFLMSTVNAFKCGFTGNLLPMNEIPHIDLSKPWWNSRIAEDTSILGVNYFYIGDMNLNTWTQSYVTYFNKKLAVDYDIPDLYGTVKSGKWTFDELAPYEDGLQGPQRKRRVRRKRPLRPLRLLGLYRLLLDIERRQVHIKGR